MDLIRRQSALVDCVSANEIRRALAAGYKIEGDPPPIVYTADIFDAESLELCVQKRIHVNCGSSDMIDQLGQRTPGVGITLRINPGFGHGHSQKTNTGGKQAKHGIWHTQIADCLARAGRYGLTVTGLHMHIGSGTDLAHLSQVCGAMEKAAAEIGPSLQSINAGGGLPTVYRPTDSYIDLDAYFALWDATRKRLEKEFGHPLRLEIEPGRYLVAESGYLVTEIRAVKRQDDNIFYLVDAGFNNLARPIFYGSYHPMSIVAGRRRRESARAGCDRGRSAMRIGRYFHPGRRRIRLHSPLAGGASRRPAGDRLRRGLRVRDGLELQFQAPGRRSPNRCRPGPTDPPPANL